MKHTALEKQLVSQQDHLAEAVISLSQGVALQPILRHVGELSMQMTGAKYAMLSYIENGEKSYIPLGMDDAQLARLSGNNPKGIGLLGLMWNQHEIVRINTIAHHEKSSGFPEGHTPMTTFLGAPLMFKDEIEGVLYLTEQAGGRPFTSVDETIVRTLASACAIAISNVKHIGQLQARNQELEAMLKANK